MLDSLRRGAQTLVAKILLGLLVASFAIWGIAGQSTGLGGNTVAEVGDTPISATDFQRDYTQEMRNLTRQLGQPLTYEQAASFGLPQRVLGRLLSEAALSDQAASLGIAISDERLAAEIAADPSLQNNGTFNLGYFEQLLRSNGLTQQQYVADRRTLEIRRQVADGLFGGVKPPVALIEAVSAYRNETRDVEYVSITRQSVDPIEPPDEATLTSFFDARKADFRAPEYRALTLLALNAAAIADPAAVSADEVQAEYDRNAGRYGSPESRTIEQILYPSLEEAQTAHAALATGSTFDSLLAERGVSPADASLGTLTRDRVLDPAIAEAAFALPAGGISEPVAARFGGAIVRVSAVNAASLRPLAEVEAEIRQDIALNAAQRVVLDTHDEIEDALAGGATLTEVAGRFNLTPTSVAAIDAEGRDEAGQPVAGLPEAPEFLGQAFETDVGVENPPVQIGRDGYVWYEVARVTPARDRTLDEVRDRVVAAWTEDEAARRMSAKAEEVMKALTEETDFAAVATRFELTPQVTPKFARGTQETPIGRDAQQSAFAGPEGYVAQAAGPQGERIVLKVREVTPVPFFAEAQDSVEAATGLATEFENSLLQQYVTHLQASLGVSVNETVLRTVIGTGGS
ncbi:peptidylprolyl isomerase [Methylobrevis albus]|uniref:Parvulin-like PPIase n=1 Tax=Methylobrevis albus TaxID=2793297 RepID=A0A931N1K5_9HYPH|nr:peptidylprolyl isomerase [Methylobrevis albus]MBH0239921.1 SurA N-terminal domain-containing protein [Methylobrevis albus]